MSRVRLFGRKRVGDAASPDPQGPGEHGVRPGIVLGYSLAGLALVVLSGVATKVYAVPLTAQLGLFQLLPPAYWLGLGLIGAGAFLAVRSGSDGMVAITGLILLATLAGTPALFEPVPRYWDSFMHFGQAQELAASGSVSTGDPSRYSANWPGAFLTIWTLFKATGLSPMDYLGLYPFLVGGITFLAIFELLRAVFNAGIARAASVPTALFAVWAQFHVSPQSLGFVLMLLVLATARRPETRWRLTAAVLFLGLVVSHPTSAILILVTLAATAVLSAGPVIRRRATPVEERRDARFIQRLALTFATVWLAWLFFQAVGSSEAARTAILTRMDVILGIPEQTLNLVTARTVQNMLPWAGRIRSASLGVYGLVGMISLILLFRDRASRNQFRLVLGVVLSAGFVTAADVFAFNGQFYDRSILLFAIFVPGLCFTGLPRIRIPRTMRRGIAVALVAASVATASTAYYLEAFNLVPRESVAAADFLEQLPDGSVAMDGMTPTPVWREADERTVVARVGFGQVYPTPLEYVAPGVPVYAVFDPTAELWYRQWYGTETYDFYLDARTNWSLVYDNGWSEVYAVHG